jgi:hypothetical protein
MKKISKGIERRIERGLTEWLAGPFVTLLGEMILKADGLANVKGLKFLESRVCLKPVQRFSHSVN